MSILRRVLVVASVSVLLAACGGGGSGSPGGNKLVTSQIANNTNDTAEPVSINDSNLQFSENPAAFDSLFD
jgi:hypothetical protein